MRRQPITVSINLTLVYLNALIWLLLGIIISFGLTSAIPDIPGMRLGLAIISFVIAAMLVALTFLLRRHNRNAYYLTLVFFVGTSILTFTDQIGLADVIFLILSVLPIVLLVIDRKWYLHGAKIEPPGEGA
jgi:hypothetical protein